MRPTVLIAGVAVLLAGCGLLAPTPAQHRPALPRPETMPEIRAEDVVDELEALGYACWFDRGGDIPSSWNCRLGDQDRNDYADVTIASARTGPIDYVRAYRAMGLEEQPVDATALDASAAAEFAAVQQLVIPEARRPTEDELLGGVQSNFPMELGDGWYVGFDRNSISRTMNIVYAADP